MTSPRHTATSPRRRLARHGLEIVTLAALYFGAAKLGLLFSFVQENVTLVWPPSGVALAALLLYGLRLWPGLVLGAFAATASTGAPLSFALATGIGNPLEVVAAYYILRLTGFDAALERIRDVPLLLLAAAVSSTIAATIGVTALCSAGMAPWSAFASIWRAWWLGDGMGMVMLAPLALTWALDPSLAGFRERALEAGWLIIGTLVVSGVVFGGWLIEDLALIPRTAPSTRWPISPFRS